MPVRPLPRPVRRAAVALGALLLLGTGAAACQKNADGSISVDQAFLCVRTGDGDIRWTANKDCRDGEILVRVDDGPSGRTWTGQLTPGVQSPAVSSDGAARSIVQLVAENVQIGGGAVATCDAGVHGGGTVTGYTGVPITGSNQFVVEWTSPGPEDGVTVTCTNASDPTWTWEVALSVTPS
ncbi:hypothetical protein [Dermatobacter hominis]|uniref:hypothetical protein n=1 Tax=Dermatobacter hominis TaxID=2884263 RepID=UPI001D101EC5|nr:hypothetical protein [Dermatobacter hominis]UDY34826.1 hypothetical protein LH044_15970 [Dermatobacter hominis]